MKRHSKLLQYTPFLLRRERTESGYIAYQHNSIANCINLPIVSLSTTRYNFIECSFGEFPVVVRDTGHGCSDSGDRKIRFILVSLERQTPYCFEEGLALKSNPCVYLPILRKLCIYNSNVKYAFLFCRKLTKAKVGGVPPFFWCV